MKTEQLIGHVPVDAGTLCIVDPCYLIASDKGHHPLTEVEWGKLIPNLCSKEAVANFNFSHKAGTGIMFGGFGGDGCYPVFVERDEKGRATKLIVKFAND